MTEKYTEIKFTDKQKHSFYIFIKSLFQEVKMTLNICIGIFLLAIGLILAFIGTKNLISKKTTFKSSLAIFGTVIAIIGFRLLGSS